MRKKRLDRLKQDETMLVINIFGERKKDFRERKKTEKIRAKRICVIIRVDRYAYLALVSTVEILAQLLCLRSNLTNIIVDVFEYHFQVK
nr:hypothetical protein [Tanacetum cinerariifolium]